MDPSTSPQGDDEPSVRARVLVIEDQPQMRRNLATLLRLEGFQPLTASDGKEGIAMALAERPDLIICDIMMPAEDGYGVLRALREHEDTMATPFIFLTARGERGDLRCGMNLGADDYLAKPVDGAELLATVRARLQRRKAQERVDGSAAFVPSFSPDFSSSKPLMSLGLTAREAEVLLWVAQGKTNAAIAVVLGMKEQSVKKHLWNIFQKLGLENRHAAMVQAFEVLARQPSYKKTGPGSTKACHD